MKWLSRVAIDLLINDLEDLKEAENIPYKRWYEEQQKENKELCDKIKEFQRKTIGKAGRLSYPFLKGRNK